MKKKEVISQITKAFGDVPMPAPENLMQIGAAAITTDPGDDAHYVASALADKRWQDLHAGTLRTGHDAFGMMTIEGIHYYLPAFLVQTLEDPVEMDVEVYQTIGFLSPPPYGKLSYGPYSTLAEFEDKMHFLTGPQRTAIRSFFKYLNEHLEEYGLWTDDPDDQLTTYWQSELSESNSLAP